jgi:hypothetical protein
VYAISFGFLVFPAEALVALQDVKGGDNIGVTVYLLATVAAQLSAAWSSGMPFVVGGTCFEVLPLLVGCRV